MLKGQVSLVFVLHKMKIKTKILIPFKGLTFLTQTKQTIISVLRHTKKFYSAASSFNISNNI